SSSMPRAARRPSAATARKAFRAMWTRCRRTCTIAAMNSAEPAAPRATAASPTPPAPASTAWPAAGGAAAVAAAGRTVAVAGATGLVGREILQGLLADDSVAAVHALGRRKPGFEHPKL